MTRFERHLEEIKSGGDGLVILRERKAELQELERKGKAEKNGWRREILAQEYVKLQREYDEIAELI